MQEFYISLPSNVNSPEFPNNTTSNFKTVLLKTINLTGNWEVALTEISFPQSWYNVKNYMTEIKIANINDQSDYSIIHFPYGYYKNIEELINTINNNMPSHINSFIYNHRQQKTILKIKSNYKIRLHSELAAILGFYSNFIQTFYYYPDDLIKFKETKNINLKTKKISRRKPSGFPYKAIPYKKDKLIRNTPLNHDIVIPSDKNERFPLNTYISKNSINLNSSIDSLYIYTNIINNVIIGNTENQLLRIISIDNINHLNFITKHLLNPYYIKIKFNEIKIIEISIRDNLGKLITFEFGKIVLTLHFREIFQGKE